MNVEAVIRPEHQSDLEPIFSVVSSAFQSDVEARLVNLIRERDLSILSLVALHQLEIVGHLMVSLITIAGGPSGRFTGLAPLSVKPTHQRRGIGAQLMVSAIDLLTKMQVDAVFLLGEPKYYGRFGFVASHVRNEYGATDAFMHLELESGALAGITGTAKYVPEFSEVGA